MSQGIRGCIKTLEKLSLVTCSEDVLQLLERALTNVEPILKVNTQGVEPLIWQNELNKNRLHNDEPRTNLDIEDLKKNAAGFFEDYVIVGLPLKGKGPTSQ